MKSNCLFEAIKAKLRNPSVEIHLYPPEINNHKFHFYWIDGDGFYHFIKDNEKSFLLFEGHIKKNNAKIFYSLLGHKMFMSGLNREQAYQLAKKYRLPFTKDDIESIYFNEEND